MFWDNIAWVYDIFADGINRKANRKLCKVVAGLISPTDDVLECACGTGLLSGVIAKCCKSLTATDFSAKMLTRARKKYGQYPHVRFEQADILHLPYPDARFDAVVAANVIHLLDNPHQALRELDRVCKPGGKLIIPTYMNRTDKGKQTAFPASSARRARISSANLRWKRTGSSSPTRAIPTCASNCARGGFPARWR